MPHELRSCHGPSPPRGVALEDGSQTVLWPLVRPAGCPSRSNPRLNVGLTHTPVLSLQLSWVTLKDSEQSDELFPTLHASWVPAPAPHRCCSEVPGGTGGGGVAGSTAPALREGELGAPEGREAAASPLHLSSSPKLEILSHPPLLWSLLPRSRPRASRAPAPLHLLPEALPGLCSQGLFPLCSFSTVLVTSRPHRAPSEHTPKPTRSLPPPLRLLQPQHLWRLGPGRALGIAGSSAASQASARGISIYRPMSPGGSIAPSGEPLL